MDVTSPLGQVLIDRGTQTATANAHARRLLRAWRRHDWERAAPDLATTWSAEIGDAPVARFSRLRHLRLRDGTERAFHLHFVADPHVATVRFEPADWSLGFLDELSEAVAVTDERARIVCANSALSNLLGTAPGRLVGCAVREIAEAISVNRGDIDKVLGAAALRRPMSDTFPFVLADGRSGMIQVSTSPWRYAGHVCGVLWRAADVTDTAENAQHVAGALWYRLTAIMQHELRNPLQTVQAAVALLRDGAAGPQSGQALDMIDQQVQAMSDYLGDQLRPRSPGLLELGRLSAVVDTEIERASCRWSTRGLRFVHNAPVHEPPLRLHPGSLALVFANLFRNSAKARPDARVQVEYRLGRRTMSCLVTDNGPGFPPHMTRLDRWAPAIDPTAHLGLMIVASTIHAHGGSIEIGNVPAGGARVTLRLPLADAADRASEPPSQTRREQSLLHAPAL